MANLVANTEFIFDILQASTAIPISTTAAPTAATSAATAAPVTWSSKHVYHKSVQYNCLQLKSA